MDVLIVGLRSVTIECALEGGREGGREEGRKGGREEGGGDEGFVYRRRDIGKKLALEWCRRLAPKKVLCDGRDVRRGRGGHGRRGSEVGGKG